MYVPPRLRGAFRTDETARALYAEGAGIFRIVPAAVAVPADLEDVRCLVRWAAETGTPVVPRGAGSGMAGGNVGPGVVVDLTRAFREPPTIDPVARRARAGASVTYRELNAAAAGYGLRLPPDPSSGAFCTIGGMVSTNAAGARSLKYGAIRDWVDAVEFVTADAEPGRAGEAAPAADSLTAAERRFFSDVAPDIRRHRAQLEARGPSTLKNSSGYDLSRHADEAWIRNLLIGSEGTLAIVSAVEVRLAPLPEELSTLLVTLRSLGDVAPAVDALGPLAPSAVELLDRTYLDRVRAAAGSRLPSDAEAVLLVELEGEGRVAADRLHGIAECTLLAADPSAGTLWELRHLASPILAALPDHMRSLQVVEDGCVPRARLGEYIAQLRDIATRCGFEVVIFGHAGDGHVHANLLADVTRADVVERLRQCLDAVTAVQVGLAGTMAGEHGDGRLRAPYLDVLYGPLFVEYCRRVKAAWDPGQILNPGVKIAPADALGAGSLPPDALKVGWRAPALPAEVAAALRRVEREASWGAFRLDLAPAPAASAPRRTPVEP